LSKERRPKRAIVGSILGMLGGLWAILSYLLAGVFFFAGALGGGIAWFTLGLFSLVVPPIVTIASLIACVLVLSGRFRAGGAIYLTCSLLILGLPLLLLVAGGSLYVTPTGLISITFFWIGPFMFLFTGGICVLSSRKPLRLG